VGGERQAWEFLDQLLDLLGDWGMSSDSSDDGQGIEDVYRVKILPWRKDITKELDLIDSERRFAKKITKDQNDVFNKIGFSQQGTKPRRRIRSDAASTSERYPLAGLPAELYDPTYLETLPRARADALNISRNQFQWLELVLGS